MLIGKQAFLQQALLQLLKRLLQCAGAGRFHGFHDQLEFTPAFVKADACPDQDFLAVLRRKSQVAVGAPEHCATNLRMLILQGEVNMAGTGP